MRAQWFFVGALALAACTSIGPSPGPAHLGAPGEQAMSLVQTGQLVVRIAWPRRIQTIPYSSNRIDLTVEDDQGDTLASASISQSTGQTASQTTLTVPAGSISVSAQALAGSTIVAQGTTSGTVAVNRQSAIVLSLVPVFVPTISSLPANAGSGALVHITGTNFGASRGVPLSVTFAGIPSPNTWAVDDDDIEAMVPSGFASGSVVVIADNVSSAASQTFWLLTGLSPVSPTGATISIGQNATFSITASDSAGVVNQPDVSWSIGPVGLDQAGMASGSLSAATGSQTVFEAASTGSTLITVRSGSLTGNATIDVQ